MSESPVLASRDGAVLTVTLNLPDRRNPISDPAMVDALCDVFEAADRDASIHVAILTGAGSAFSSGGDLNAMRPDAGGLRASLPAQTRESFARTVDTVLPLLDLHNYFDWFLCCREIGIEKPNIGIFDEAHRRAEHYVPGLLRYTHHTLSYTLFYCTKVLVICSSYCLYELDILRSNRIVLLFFNVLYCTLVLFSLSTLCAILPQRGDVAHWGQPHYGLLRRAGSGHAGTLSRCAKCIAFLHVVYCLSVA